MRSGLLGFTWLSPWAATLPLTSGAGFLALSWRARVLFCVEPTLHQLAWRPKAFPDPMGSSRASCCLFFCLKMGAKRPLGLPGFIPS